MAKAMFLDDPYLMQLPHDDDEDYLSMDGERKIVLHYSVVVPRKIRLSKR